MVAISLTGCGGNSSTDSADSAGVIKEEESQSAPSSADGITCTETKAVGHDPKEISVFEINSAYFSDTIFNHIHHSAKINLTSGSSLTDEYVRHIHAYVIGVKNDARCYSDIVQGVHTYFTGTTRFTTLSFVEFVDRVVGVCVPEEYFKQFYKSS